MALPGLEGLPLDFTERNAALGELRGAFRRLEVRHGSVAEVAGTVMTALFAAPGEVINNEIARQRVGDMDYRLANLGDWLKTNAGVKWFPALWLSPVDQVVRRLPEHRLKIPKLNVLVDGVRKTYSFDTLPQGGFDFSQKARRLEARAIFGGLAETISKALAVGTWPDRVVEALFADSIGEKPDFTAGASPVLRRFLSDRTGGNLGIIRRALGMEEAKTLRRDVVEPKPAVVREVGAGAGEAAMDRASGCELLRIALSTGEDSRLALAAHHVGKTTTAEVTGGDRALLYADLVMSLDEGDLLRDGPLKFEEITLENGAEEARSALIELAKATVNVEQVAVASLRPAEVDRQLLRFLVGVKRARREDLLAIAGRVLKVESPGEIDLQQFFANAVETAIAAGARLGANASVLS